MILGIGIDSVEIERFSHWAQMPYKSLQRIFSPEEINYCLSCPIKSAERFASRFAAREALFKGLHSAYPTKSIPFLRLCKSVSIKKTAQGAPVLTLALPELPLQLAIHLSWTHSRTIATAYVILERV